MKSLSFNSIKAVVKKEISTMLNSSGTYIVAIVFLVTWLYLFFRFAFVVSESSLRGLFDTLPWLLIIAIPALTMGSISREKDEGTLELLLTRPLREIELIIGKWLSVVLFFAILFLTTVVLAVIFSFYGSFDFG